jgi:hypothetical protein
VVSTPPLSQRPSALKVTLHLVLQPQLVKQKQQNTQFGTQWVLMSKFAK